MAPKITQQETQRRHEGARKALQDAGDDVQTVAELNTRVGAAFGGTKNMGERTLSDFLKTLSPGHALRQKFDAIKQRSQSHSARSAAQRLSRSGADAKSLDVARQERTAYAAARRRLPTTRATGQRLLREINVATKATAGSIKEVLGARVECACISGLDEAAKDFETAVGLAGSVGAVKVAPGGFCFVRTDLLEHAGTRWDDFVDE